MVMDRSDYFILIILRIPKLFQHPPDLSVVANLKSIHIPTECRYMDAKVAPDED